MCLYPRIMRNKKYTRTKKNNGIVPQIKDKRTEFITVGCGKCIECTKKRANNWKVRLYEEIQQNKNGKFVTLTFNDKSLNDLMGDVENNKDPNEIATLAVRRFLERYRKKHKKSLRHWLVTELGHKNTERIHLHGIIFIDDSTEIEKYWQYGWVYIGEYVNEKTINYISKYVTKIDVDHKWFTGKVLTSAGIGSNYINKLNSKINTFNGTETIEVYKNNTGFKTALPMYYRNKIYTEEERQMLWINKLNENTRYVCGEKIDISTTQGIKMYERCRDFYRKKNKQLGYGSMNWNSGDYKEKCEMLRNNANNINKITTIEEPKAEQLSNSAEYRNSLNNKEF